MAGGLKRLATAAIGLPIFFVIIKYLHPYVFLGLVCLAAVVATFELHLLARRKGISGDRLLGAGFALTALHEPTPTPEQLARAPGNDDLFRVPIYVIYELRK